MVELTEEQKMLVQNVRDIATKKIAPRAAEVDESEEYPWDYVELFKQNGIFSLPVPEEYGGAGGDLTACCLVAEELVKADSFAAMLFSTTAMIVQFLKVAGNKDQKTRYLPELAQGKLAAVSLTEPDAGSDASAIKTTATLRGDHYILNGTKAFASNAIMADVIVTFAKVTPGDGRLTGFIVDKGTPGVTIGHIEKKLGFRAWPTGELIFEGAAIPVKNRLGAEGEGFKAIWATFNEGRILHGAMAVGLAESSLDCSISYAKQRVQFGKPIASFQGIQFMLADMAIQTEAARCLLYDAAARLDRNDEQTTKFASMAKVYCSDVGMKVTTDAVQILGGYGYTRSYPVERMMRDAKALQIIEGTNQIQRTIIARSLVGRFD